MIKTKMTPIEARKSRGITPGFISKSLNMARNSYWRRETLKTSWKPEEIEAFLKITRYRYEDVDFSMPQVCQKTEHLPKRSE